MKRKTGSKKLCNSFSTGGGGHHFEAHLQAAFVALMLSGGVAPCLPCWPIVEVKLQGKIDGYDTDDCIVTVENPSTRERRKLLCQMKHSISITQSNSEFSEVIQSAWNDFNNPRIFTKDKDRIALISGPLSAVDEHNVQWLLNSAKGSKTSIEEFFRNVEQAKFSPPESEKKLDVFRHHLAAANGGIELNREELYSFLAHFFLLDYDLGNEYGVALSLLHSHIAQFQQQDPQIIWARIVEVVQTFNQDAGTLKPDNLPEDLLEAFKQKRIERVPDDFQVSPKKTSFDWERCPEPVYLALAVLIGAWNDKNSNDLQAVSSVLGISYEDWMQKAQILLVCSGSPLTLNNGIWRVRDRTRLWETVGSSILDRNLDAFQAVAVRVLNDRDPAFELPVKERYAAGIYGKVPVFSDELREGIAEGVALLGSRPEKCSNCSQNKAKGTATLVVRELFSDADWVLWGSLNRLLPDLAEASPPEFLNAVAKALRSRTCPFDELFAQEGDGHFGDNYLTGLLWALEGLAWDVDCFVKTCILLGELAGRDPGGQWDNRPSNSLTTIMLPWLPHTLATFEKRQVAVKTLLRDCPNVGWNLLLNLLPDQIQTTSGSHRPRWRMKIPDDREREVTQEEYWQQATFYGKLAVEAAGNDTARLSQLIDFFDHLPQPAFEDLLDVLASESIAGLPEDRRLVLWDHLTKFTRKHRRYSEANWALSDELLSRIESVGDRLAPEDLFNLYQPLFSEYDSDLYDEKGGWEEQQRKIYEKRQFAVRELLRKYGTDGLIRFAETVRFPEQVGDALGIIGDDSVERFLFPGFLDAGKEKRNAFLRGFILGRYRSRGWEWCDTVDRTKWSSEQTARFLVCLPFEKEAWDRASLWLGDKEGAYWSLTSANPYGTKGDLSAAIDKLIEYGRPNAAIECFYIMQYFNQPIDIDQCVQVLLMAPFSDEPVQVVKANRIVELIKFLQSEPSVNPETLICIEWAYLPLLDHYRGAEPKLLERKMADDPVFFCDLIKKAYRSKNGEEPLKEEPEVERAMALNAWRLLHEWKRPPGLRGDGSFCPEKFDEWLGQVKMISAESGHLEIALHYVGEVLIQVPADPGGLWIHPTVAAALDSRDAEDMRSGFRTGVYNSRGVHWIDPTGKPEKELAAQYRRKAEETENAGFPWFAVTLRNLAGDYERESASIIADAQQREPE